MLFKSILTHFRINKGVLEIERTVADEFTRICMLKTKHKIKSIDLYSEPVSKLNRREATKAAFKAKSSGGDQDDNDASDECIVGECKIACLLNNNQIDIYLLRLDKQLTRIQAPALVHTLDTPGHRTDVRTLCFSSDSTAFVSASGDSMKVWNRMNLTCIRTFACDYALSSLFMSDDNHVLIGTNVNISEITMVRPNLAILQ